MYATLVIQKMSFLNIKELFFVRNKVLLTYL